MKTFVIQALACCTALFPFSQAQAAAKFGDFVAGQTFTMHVATVSEIGKRPVTLPKYTKGQAVKFTISSKGQLTGKAAGGPTFSINYKSISKLPRYHENYFDNKAPTAIVYHQAVVDTKGSDSKPYFINLVLRQQVDFTAYQGGYTFK